MQRNNDGILFHFHEIGTKSERKGKKCSRAFAAAMVYLNMQITAENPI